jgi:hypothetical protein
MRDNHGAYDPRGDLRQLRGKGGTASYLNVKHRIKWLRNRYPDSIMQTEHIELTAQRAIFRATVIKMDGSGREVGTATGYGSETPSDFGDYIEKAETKAIGRALAALGFGTQFVGGEGYRIVDSPVDQ